MENRNITELYQEIGTLFRRLGADQVILLSSKVLHDSEYELYLEIAVDGAADLKELQEESRKQWPDIEMQLLLKTEELDGELLDEIQEYGILL